MLSTAKNFVAFEYGWCYAVSMLVNLCRVRERCEGFLASWDQKAWETQHDSTPRETNEARTNYLAAVAALRESLAYLSDEETLGCDAALHDIGRDATEVAAAIEKLWAVEASRRPTHVDPDNVRIAQAVLLDVCGPNWRAIMVGTGLYIGLTTPVLRILWVCVDANYFALES